MLRYFDEKSGKPLPISHNPSPSTQSVMLLSCAFAQTKESLCWEPSIVYVILDI